MKANESTKISSKERFNIYGKKSLVKIVLTMIEYDKLFQNNKTERFIIAGINRTLHLVCIGNITFGKMNIQDPNDIFQDAVLRKARYAIIIQYVKDKKTEPTDKDIKNTIDLMTANSAIKILDHIIVSNGSYFSFEEEGYMKEIKKSIKNNKKQIKNEATATLLKNKKKTNNGK